MTNAIAHAEQARKNPSNDTQNSDRAVDLVVRARRGCQEAEAELFQSHYSRLLAIARNNGLSSDESADAVQRTWIKARSSLDKLRDDRCFKSWISTIARNEAISLLRVRNREAAAPVEVIDTSFVVDSDASMISREEADYLRVAVARLGREDRRLLKLLFEDRKDYRQIAEELSCPIGSIGPTRGRILARLRHMVEGDLSDRCYSMMT